MRCRTRLHADKAPRQSLEEAQNLNTADRFADHHGTVRIDAMDLKNVLRQINSDRRNLVHGWLPQMVILDDTILALQMPSGGHPPHHLTLRRAHLLRSGYLRALSYNHLTSVVHYDGVDFRGQ
jgi:hypothetical protein